MNNRITPKERSLLKGAIRRVFARSELRRQVLERVSVDHSDSKHTRVKKWGYCELCGEILPKYKLVIDHKDPVIPLNSSFEIIGADKTIDRTWCIADNLQAVCEDCHKIKTKYERNIRKKYKDESLHD